MSIEIEPTRILPTIAADLLYSSIRKPETIGHTKIA